MSNNNQIKQISYYLNPVELAFHQKNQDLDSKKNTIYAIIALSIPIFHAILLTLLSADLNIFPPVCFLQILFIGSLTTGFIIDVIVFILILKSRGSLNKEFQTLMQDAALSAYIQKQYEECEGFIKDYNSKIDDIIKFLELPFYFSFIGFFLFLVSCITLFLLK